MRDADIFKAQFYKIYSSKGEKDSFISEWKSLEELSEKIFHPQTGTPIGDNVMIGPNTLISTVNHPLTPMGRRQHLGIAKPVSIGNDV